MHMFLQRNKTLADRVPITLNFKNDIVRTLKVRLKLLELIECKKIVPRVLEKIVKFVDTFYDL